MITNNRYERCERCNRKVRVDTDYILGGLWEYKGKGYGYHCFQILTGQIPDPSKKIKFYDPEWDNWPIPF
jgi:hypothetical protein